jgi:DNA (cytosine-5)-methyltransferase 1
MPDSVISAHMKAPLRIAELFAGVGGFRLGFEGRDQEHIEQFAVVFSNQWEPSTIRQHASEVYEYAFGSKGHNPNDIGTVSTEDIPDIDVLVGGFPCQDYSVAKSLPSSMGLFGKKGVLWWQIERILRQKHESGKTVPYVVLENVDRLVKSPATQRGRDFAVMLSSLNNLGYHVEWRVVNASEYGFPQRRRRLFIVGVHGTIAHSLEEDGSLGILERAFPIEGKPMYLSQPLDLSEYADLSTLSENFNLKTPNAQPFKNSGFVRCGLVHTLQVVPLPQEDHTVLGDILIDEAPDEYYVLDSELEKWQYLKGAKAEKRVTSEGFEYDYTEGGMVFPDALDNASRTIITGEGGRTASRFKHVVECKSGRGLRRLTPVELERLNMFPDNHTQYGVKDGERLEQLDTKRAFFMGNALVVGVVDKIARALWEYYNISLTTNKKSS